MAGNGFPGAVWIPAHPDRYTVKTSRQIDAIVLHATDGSAVDARVTAKNVFGSPKEWDASHGVWHQQSAHYIVGRDGTVVQCVLHKDIAWHANTESLTTIGIEHNARDPGDTKLSGIQYWKSAELVVWLGRHLGLPMDRWYIWGHSEIDPTSSHSRCPQRALDWDTYMLAIAEVQAVAGGRPRQQPMRLWTADD
jgi:N-acetyl-anhydromuramyl-L-alanine amidase AmpD